MKWGKSNVTKKKKKEQIILVGEVRQKLIIKLYVHHEKYWN